MKHKKSCPLLCVRLVSFAFLLTLTAGVCQAAALHPGDIVVASQSGGKLYTIDPLSGATTLISSGGRLFDPSHVLLDNQGRILTAERAGGGQPGIVQTDPSTGTQALLASGPLLNYPVSLAFDQSHNLIVGNLGDPSHSKEQLIRVSAQSGTQTLLATLAGVSSLQDVDVDQQGRIVVLDSGTFNGGGGKVVRFDLTTGQQTTVSVGGRLFNPSDLIIRPSGDYIVANRLANETTQILQIDSVTGAQQLALTVPSEGWIALQDQNNIVYADFYDHLSVLRANVLTGQTQTITNFQFPQNLVGVAIFSPVPEPSTLTLAALALLGLAAAVRRRR